MAIPTSQALFEAGLVAGAVFVAEFWSHGRAYLAVPTDFCERRPSDRVRCIFTRRETTHGAVVARLYARQIEAVLLTRAIAVHPSEVQTPAWMATSACMMCA